MDLVIFAWKARTVLGLALVTACLTGCGRQDREVHLPAQAKPVVTRSWSEGSSKDPITDEVTYSVTFESPLGGSLAFVCNKIGYGFLFETDMFLGVHRYSDVEYRFDDLKPSSVRTLQNNKTASMFQLVDRNSDKRMTNDQFMESINAFEFLAEIASKPARHLRVRLHSFNEDHRDIVLNVEGASGAISKTSSRCNSKT